MDEMLRGAPLLPRAVAVEPLDDFILKIRFSSDETKYFDVKKIWDFPCFAPLKNKQFFKTVRIAFGSVAWGDTIDYCPDCLYEESAF